MFEAWRDGAAPRPVRPPGRWPSAAPRLFARAGSNRFNRRPIDALGLLLPKTAVLPHFDTFGHR
jgi:hypothetical protein